MKLLAALVAGLVLAMSSPASAVTPGVWDVHAVNHYRYEHHRHALPTTHLLRVAALSWAERSARVQGLRDDPEGQEACWKLGGTVFASNAGFAPDVPTVQAALDRSPPHIHNTLGNWKWMGVAYTRDQQGLVWLVQDFCG